MAATALSSREVVVGPGTGRNRARPAAALRRLGGSRWLVFVGPLLLLGVWELATTVGGVAPQTLASPTTVASTGWDLTRSGELPDALLVSLRRVAIGLLLGVSAGTALAIVSGLFPVGERLVDPLVQMFRTMPALALVPLFILWFGIDERPKVLLVAFAVAFPVYINLYGGIRGVDARLVEAGRVFGLGALGAHPPGRAARRAAPRGSWACASRSGSRGSCSSRRSRSTRRPASARS